MPQNDLPHQPREHAVPCHLCGLRITGRRVEPRTMTWNVSGLCDHHQTQVPARERETQNTEQWETEAGEYPSHLDQGLMTMPRNDLPLTITGNLTADPELRFTAAGIAVASFTVAFTPRRYDKATDEWKDGTTTFMRADAWRQLGEHCAESLSRGSRVVVTGSLNTEQWETEAGEKRSAVKLTVDDVGASLAYATVEIRKATRTDSAAPAADPWTGEAATLHTKHGTAAPEDGAR